MPRRPAQLSGGQRQRVAIGRAIVKEPKAFLFDEPLSNLDAALRVRTRVELAELHQRMKATMIYVTHDQTEAMTLADRIVVLNNCRIEQIGTPMEVYPNPASRFVAGFVGSSGDEFSSRRGCRRRPCRARLGDGSELDLAVENPGPAATNWAYDRKPYALSRTRRRARATRAKVGWSSGSANGRLSIASLSDGTELIAQDVGRSDVQPGDTVELPFDTNADHLFDDDGKVYQPIDQGCPANDRERTAGHQCALPLDTCRQRYRLGDVALEYQIGERHRQASQHRGGQFAGVINAESIVRPG